jgi:galactokinase
MIGNILNTFYNDGNCTPLELAQIAQYAENEYFGKPCGLMDQTACASGGFIFIDFKDPQRPRLETYPFDLTSHGYSLFIVNTGGNHADLTDDYASIPADMKGVAAHYGKTVLREINAADFYRDIKELRAAKGDLAILRTIHFLNENARVAELTDYLKTGEGQFLDIIKQSGDSSYKLLQNVYTNKAPSEQGISLALALTERFIKKSCGGNGACRVHGGGFAGTIQAFIPCGQADAYQAETERVFGAGSSVRLSVRLPGAIAIPQ